MMSYFRKKFKIYLSIGTNIGERKKNLYMAYSYLSSFLTDIQSASIYETTPLYLEAQPLFLNSVLSGYTTFSPGKLLKKLHWIETRMGRKRINNQRMGPRIIDLDILLFSDKSVQEKKLIIPHKSIEERKFVLLPLIELDFCIKNPISGTLYSSYLTKVESQEVNYYCSWDSVLNSYKI